MAATDARTASEVQLVVRNVDRGLWMLVRIEALRRDITMGAMVNVILRDWLDAQTLLADQQVLASADEMQAQPVAQP